MKLDGLPGFWRRPQPTGIIAPLNCARNCTDRATQIIRIKIHRIRLPGRAYLENKIKVAVIHRKNVIANQPHNSSADTLFSPSCLAATLHVRVVASANPFFHRPNRISPTRKQRETVDPDSLIEETIVRSLINIEMHVPFH